MTEPQQYAIISVFSEFKAQLLSDSRVTIIENSKNLEIAKALNQICTAAINDGYEWILTLDQDSLPEKGMIEKFSRYTDIPEAAIISPYTEDDNEPRVIDSESLRPYELSTAAIPLLPL